MWLLYQQKIFTSVMFLLLVFLSTIKFSHGLLRCWSWNVPFLEDERLRIQNRTKEPQCLFQLDVPCNYITIQRSAHYTMTYSKTPQNSCVIDKGGYHQILCACNNEDYCSSHCKYVVELWKKSSAYKNGTEHARCMDAYEKACLKKKIKLQLSEDYEEEVQENVTMK